MSKSKKEIKPKINSPKIGAEVNKATKLQEREREKQLILNLTEQIANNQFSDIALDRENEKIELLNGSVIDLREIRKIVAQQVQEYSPKFPSVFWKEIYRTNGWAVPKGKIHKKPRIVGRYINEIIYDRFSKEILPTLQYLNPYVRMGIRKYKHHQWLTEVGKEKLQAYIQDAINIMKTCDNWYEFRTKHAHAFGLSFQINFVKEEESKKFN